MRVKADLITCYADFIDSENVYTGWAKMMNI